MQAKWLPLSGGPRAVAGSRAAGWHRSAHLASLPCPLRHACSCASCRWRALHSARAATGTQAHRCTGKGRVRCAAWRGDAGCAALATSPAFGAAAVACAAFRAAPRLPPAKQPQPRTARARARAALPPARTVRHGSRVSLPLSRATCTVRQCLASPRPRAQQAGLVGCPEGGHAAFKWQHRVTQAAPSRQGWHDWQRAEASALTHGAPLCASTGPRFHG